MDVTHVSDRIGQRRFLADDLFVHDFVEVGEKQFYSITLRPGVDMGR